MAKENKKVVSEDVIQEFGIENLKRIELPLDDNGRDFLEVIVSVPNRRIMGQYLKYQNINPSKAQEILVKGCLHTDKDQVLNDDALFLTCVSALAELIPIRESKIKKY
jgi:hypothetical protein